MNRSLKPGKTTLKATLRDATWNEADHPRDDDGKFGEGGGGKSKANPPRPGAYGTHNLEKGDTVSFNNGSGDKTGVIQTANTNGAVVRDPSGEPHTITWSDVTGHKSPVKSLAAQGGFIKGPKYQAPETFTASGFAKSQDQAGVTASDILANFPPDTGAKIRAAQDRLNTIEQTAEANKSNGAYTPERLKLHRQIVFEGLTKKVMNEETGELEEKHFPGILSPETIAAARPDDGEKPTFTVLGGRGGSGKSWFKGNLLDPKKTIYLDSDHIKSLLPEYEGWNAAQVHEESGEIFDAVTAFAQTMGLNIVHDATMKSPEKAKALVEGFKAKGYKTEAHYMHLPRQEAAKRAVDRFLGKSKRFVPPEVVLANTRNEEAFDGIKHMVDKWSFRDNNVPKGPPPVLISESD